MHVAFSEDAGKVSAVVLGITALLLLTMQPQFVQYLDKTNKARLSLSKVLVLSAAAAGAAWVLPHVLPAPAPRGYVANTGSSGSAAAAFLAPRTSTSSPI